MAIPKATIERVARMYHSSQEASQALGIHPRSFARLCRKYNIESPYQRKRRAIQQARYGPVQSLKKNTVEI